MPPTGSNPATALILVAAGSAVVLAVSLWLLIALLVDLHDMLAGWPAARGRFSPLYWLADRLRGRRDRFDKGARR